MKLVYLLADTLFFLIIKFMMVNTIKQEKTILEALSLLDKLSTDNMLTLFVVDQDARLIGSLTDGDIRRYLVKGGNLYDKVIEAAHKNCTYIESEWIDNVRFLRSLRDKGLRRVPVLDKDHHIREIYDLVNFKSHLPIDAVLMAGGKGERLRPLTEKIPKPLVKVGDKCIIDYNIDRLIEFGVKHINVTVNYLKEQLQEHFAILRNGIKVETVEEPKFLGTIGSIKFVDIFYNDTILVMNSDLFTNIDYEDFFLHFQIHDAEMSVAAVPYNISIELGILDLDGHNIKGLIEKPKYNYYANAGIYLIKKRALAEIPEDTFFHATHLVEKLIAQGKKVIRYPLNGTWIDIGTYQEYERAKELVKHLK